MKRLFSTFIEKRFTDIVNGKDVNLYKINFDRKKELTALRKIKKASP